MALNAWVPEKHLDGGSADAVKLVMSLIATLSALVLGLLIASAKDTYDTQANDVVQISAGLIQLDRVLKVYGPETQDARKFLRETAIDKIKQIWSEAPVASEIAVTPREESNIERVYRAIQELTPQTDERRFAKSQALQITTDLFHTRLMIYVQHGKSISLPFLTILISWLVFLFAGFGLLTRFNGTVATAFLIGSFSVAAAIFLILELDRPYSGLMKISSDPLERALAQMSR